MSLAGILGKCRSTCVVEPLGSASFATVIDASVRTAVPSAHARVHVHAQRGRYCAVLLGAEPSCPADSVTERLITVTRGDAYLINIDLIFKLIKRIYNGDFDARIAGCDSNKALNHESEHERRTLAPDALRTYRHSSAPLRAHRLADFAPPRSAGGSGRCAQRCPDLRRVRCSAVTGAAATASREERTSAAQGASLLKM
eukprot:6183998-Pleurochrysis_carterae.AAC.10